MADNAFAPFKATILAQAILANNVMIMLARAVPIITANSAWMATISEMVDVVNAWSIVDSVILQIFAINAISIIILSVESVIW